MKAKMLLIASVVAAMPVLAADRVEPAQLPPAVKKALDGVTRGEAVKEITVHRPRGRVYYDIELERNNALNPHVRIAETGEILSDSRNVPLDEATPVYPDAAPGVATLPHLRLDELPRAAQETIRREAGGREIAVITDDSVNGRKAYAVQFRERGRNPWLYIAEDGTILRPTEKPPALGLGTTLSDTPTAVQQTVRQEIGDGQIERVDKNHERNAPDTYKFSVKDARGTYRLTISADGRVLENSRASEQPRKRG
jgi:hypothetical protein